VHLGLSPSYKGAATHFWPSYFLEPEYTGITVHELTNLVDAGPIIHQEIININKNDGIHENACRVTKKFNENFPIILAKNKDQIIKQRGIIQKNTGRNFTTKLWKPDMLKIIYELFEDKINKYCIENRSTKKIKINSILK
jgi:methionyl-tRNA formyltransferase